MNTPSGAWRREEEGLLRRGLRAWFEREVRREARRQRRDEAKPETPRYNDEGTRRDTGSEAADNGRGRLAERPRDIPASGWRDILLRVKQRLGEHNLSIIASAVAFYVFLALFPSLAAMVTIYGLIADPGGVDQLVTAAGGVLPGEAQTFLHEQLKWIASQPPEALGVGLVVSLVLTIWSATKGVRAMITALNIVYDERETRGFFKLSGLGFILTLGGILAGISALVLIVGMPAVLNFFSLSEKEEVIVKFAPWPILAIGMIAGLAVLYRFAPARQDPQWKWVTWGSVIATVLWLVGSVLFSVFVAKFGNYNETYGSVSAVVVVLLWLQVTAYIILVGGQINAEMEHQTKRDTTTGAPKPMGQRDAYVADTVGKTP